MMIFSAFLAFLWPMLIHIADQRLLKPQDGPIGLILCPTRELALQVIFLEFFIGYHIYSRILITHRFTAKQKNLGKYSISVSRAVTGVDQNGSNQKP